MQKWNFQDFHQMSGVGGIHSTTFDPELRNAFQNFSNPGGGLDPHEIHILPL